MKNLQIKKHMMTAISYLIPFVCTAGMLMVIGNIAGGTSVDDFTKQISFPDFLTSLGGTGLGFLPVIICAGVSYSIADKAGIAPGVILGLLCKDAGYGFLGSVWLLKVVKVPKWVEGLLPQLILPLLGSLIIGALMKYIVGIPILMLTNAITGMLENMQTNMSMIIPFGIIVGVLSAVDYGGPINKVVIIRRNRWTSSYLDAGIYDRTIRTDNRIFLIQNLKERYLL